MFRKKNLLFILNDLAIKKTVEQFAKYFNNIKFIENKDEALAYIKDEQNSIDLCVVDTNIAQNTGLKIVQELKSLLPQIKTVIISDKEHPDNFIKAIELKIDNFFLKPFQHIELMEKVLYLLQEKNIHDELEESKLFNLNYIRILNEIIYVARIDAHKKINYVNEKFLSLLEYSLEELHTMQYDFTSNKSDIVLSKINSDLTWQGVVQYLSKSKTTTNMNTSISAVYDKKGENIVEYLVIAYKIDNLEIYKKKFKNSFYKEKSISARLSTQLQQLEQLKKHQEKELIRVIDVLKYRKDVLQEQKKDIQILGEYVSQFQSSSAEVVSIHQKMLDNLTIKIIDLNEKSKSNMKKIDSMESQIKLYSRRLKAIRLLKRGS